MGGGKTLLNKGKSRFYSDETSFFNDVFIVSGFTLIEILGVVILLSVISLIVYPMVNKSIKENRQNSLEKTIKGIESAALIYSVSNELEYNSSYTNLDLNILKEAGLIENKDLINPVTNEELKGCLVYLWINKQYEFKYIEPCQDTPVIAINNKDGIFNNKGWAVSAFYIDIVSNGTSYEYCISDKECVPDTVVENNSGQVYINANGINYVCVKASNDLGNTEVICEQYKLDTSNPIFASTTIYFDKGDNKLTDLLEINSISGYNINCSKEYINELIIGDNSVSCTIIGDNGKTTIQNITFSPNKMKTANSSDTTFL